MIMYSHIPNDSGWNMMYLLMDIVNLGCKITPYRRIGSNVNVVGSHIFEEPGVDQITLERVPQFIEARQAAIDTLAADGITEKAFE
jgi:hypothetical protein